MDPLTRICNQVAHKDDTLDQSKRDYRCPATKEVAGCRGQKVSDVAVQAAVMPDVEPEMGLGLPYQKFETRF